MNFKINKNNTSKIIWDISTEIPFPTWTGFAIFFKKLRSGINNLSKKLNAFKYLPVNFALYGVSLEYRNNPIIKILMNKYISILI